MTETLATYARFAEHVQNRQVVPPKILYKYMTLETAHKVLSTGTLRFHSPLCYNDPFDAQLDPIWQLRLPESKRLESEMFEMALRDPSSWPTTSDYRMRLAMDAERRRIQKLSKRGRDIAIKRYLLQATDSSPEEREFEQSVADRTRRMRICCLSKIANSLLMWSHYADQHRGIVLGLDSIALEHTWQAPLEPVEYATELPRIFDPKLAMQAWIFGAIGGNPSEAELRRLVLTKHLEWSYEHEWRTVMHSPPGTPGDYADLPFEQSAIKQVFFGCRANRTVLHDFESLIHKQLSPDTEVFNYSKHPHKFELVANKHP